MKSSQNTVCPDCGGRKYYKSKRCIECHTAGAKHQTSRHLKDVCPGCGRPKLLKSRVCRACWAKRDLPVRPYLPPVKADLSSPDWPSVSRDFLLQFVGVFMSEGSVRADISRDSTFALGLTIQLRIDDLRALEAIQAQLGGAVHIENRRNHSAMGRWAVTKREDVRAIVAAMRALILIPMKKARELDVVFEYFGWRDVVGWDYVDRERVREFHDRVADLKKYTG